MYIQCTNNILMLLVSSSLWHHFITKGMCLASGYHWYVCDDRDHGVALHGTQYGGVSDTACFLLCCTLLWFLAPYNACTCAAPAFDE